jgi:aconitate hydratase
MKLDGTEVYEISGIEKDLFPQKQLTVFVNRKDGSKTSFSAMARIDSMAELTYYINGGILPYVVRNLK